MSTPPAAKPGSATIRRCSGKVGGDAVDPHLGERHAQPRQRLVRGVAPWTISLAISES